MARSGDSIFDAPTSATKEEFKTKRSEVLEVLKASIEVENTHSEENSEIISKWMALTPAKA